MTVYASLNNISVMLCWSAFVLCGGNQSTRRKPPTDRSSLTNVNTTGATNGAESAYLSGASEFTTDISEICIAQYFAFCVLFCRTLFVLLSVFFKLLYSLSFDKRFLSTPSFFFKPFLSHSWI